jgi:uncharacterized paraquat-inducible protein A
LGKTIASRRSRYLNGFKYCSRCRAYYPADSARCPICNLLLRSKPRKKGKRHPASMAEKLLKLRLKIFRS